MLPERGCTADVTARREGAAGRAWLLPRPPDSPREEAASSEKTLAPCSPDGAAGTVTPPRRRLSGGVPCVRHTPRAPHAPRACPTHPARAPRTPRAPHAPRAPCAAPPWVGAAGHTPSLGRGPAGSSSVRPLPPLRSQRLGVLGACEGRQETVPGRGPPAPTAPPSAPARACGCERAPRSD